MAGGKESPRQKMIGMMYLVLTALLALNVSTSVLDKFISINDAFETTNGENGTENGNKVAAIQKAVEESGNRKQDLSVLTKAQEVRSETQKILAKLEEYKEELIEITGGRDEGTGVVLGKKDIDAASSIFVHEGKGDVLKEELNGYVQFLRDKTGMTKEELRDIARDAKDIEAYKNDEDQMRKGFAELNFGHNTPMVGALATLSQFQADILLEETKALENLAAEVGAADLKFDKIIPMVKPISKYVAAGTKYEADLFITAASSSVQPTMKVNGKDIPVEGGFGKVSFTATPGSYDKEGNARKTFIGEITLKQPGKKDTTFTDTIEYFVTKPVIQIQSASVQALYLNCGNELNVNVPALGTSYNPSFNVKGGTSVKGADKGQVTIVPKSAKVTLSVSSNGNLIGSQDFKVKRIPKPEIKVYSGGREVDMKRGVKSCPRSIKLQAVADESFAQFLPKDAKFQVAGAEITLVRSGRAVVPMKTTSPNVNLSRLASQARSGDAIVIEIKKVKRKNFQGKIEDFPNFSPKILNIRIN
ncbi:type IX secretion system motor protein PorM/GldM [Reichenbachiella versicolor]|uniref:type IX secretion system motor protein PorM/GldM n=1 Tax=Reichenbachiella versicolor TaxID=1821036 RepID=UPI000D6E77DC|nr:gliding motility protein GldM [Reichenbachiella versicolor]